MADNRQLTEDEIVLHGMGYAQELSRRMGPFQSFAISFAIICIISGGFGSFPIALSSGGPFSLTVGWIIGGVYALIIAASLGQIASAYPTAGSLYHWSSILGGRFWGWATAFVNLLGLLFVIPAVNVFLYFITKDLFCAYVLGWDVSTWGTWTQIWFTVALTAAQCALNHFGIGLTTKLTDIAGYLILGVTTILIIMFAANATDFNIGRTFEFANNTGAAGGGVVGSEKGALMAFLIGLLYPLFTITGFDASAHTAEETVDARNTVHKGMINSVLWSLIFGFVLIVVMLLCIPDYKVAAAEGWSSFNNLFTRVILGSFIGKLMLIGVLIANFLCALAAVTSTSRMIYAFARDGGLPFSELLGSVSPTHRTPNAAIWFTFILTSILVMVTTPLGAFAALSTGCAMYLYMSYAMPIIAGFFAEGKTWTTYGNFRLGGLSKLFGIITMIGTVVVIVAGHAFVPSVAADAAAGTGFVPGLIWYTLGFGVFLGLLWMFSENRRFKGPPMGDEIKRRQTEIEAREASISGRPVASGTMTMSSATPMASSGSTGIRSSVQAAAGVAAVGGAALASASSGPSAAELREREAEASALAKANAERAAAARAAAERNAAERLAAARAAAEKAVADRVKAASSDNSASIKRATPVAKASVAKSKAPAKKAAKPVADIVDDISLISGIGPKIKQQMIKAGYPSLKSIASMSVAQLAKIDGDLGFSGRGEREEWIAQAKELLAGKAPRAAVDKAKKKAK